LFNFTKKCEEQNKYKKQKGRWRGGKKIKKIEDINYKIPL
jgi:hypothetical protein